MAEIKIVKNGENIDQCVIPPELNDSKVAEKFVTAYLENMSKIQIEKEKTDYLKEQNNRKNGEEKYKLFYVLILILLLFYSVGIFSDKLSTFSIASSVILLIVDMIGIGYLIYKISDDNKNLKNAK